MVKPADSRTIDEVDTEIRNKASYLPDHLLLEERLLQSESQRKEASPDCFHEEKVLGFGELRKDFELCLVEARRLAKPYTSVHGRRTN